MDVLCHFDAIMLFATPFRQLPISLSIIKIYQFAGKNRKFGKK